MTSLRQTSGHTRMSDESFPMNGKLVDMFRVDIVPISGSHTIAQLKEGAKAGEIALVVEDNEVRRGGR